MKDLVRYVDGLSAEAILQRSMVTGDYGIEGNKIELPSVILQGNGVLAVRALVRSSDGYIAVVGLNVIHCNVDGREYYQFRIGSGGKANNLNLTPQGGQLGTAEPIPTVQWPRGNLNITQLVLVVLKIAKKINSSQKLNGTNGRSENV